jgi:type IV secretory pathway VirB10-like protein
MKARNIGWMAAVTIAGGALLGACNRGPSEREQQLEQRVKELEAQQAASPDPSAFPEVTLDSPAAPPQYTLAPEAPAAPRASSSRPAASRRTAAPSSGAASASRAPAPAPRGTSAAAPAERPSSVERIEEGEAARGDSDWPAGEAETREPAARETQAVVVPANTQLTLRLENGLSSATSNVGDRVTARVERAVSDQGDVVLPGGTVLHGRVSEAEGAGRVKGRARLGVAFDRIVVRGRSYPLQATVISAIADDSHSRDAKVIGGSAVAGAIIGGLKGGKSGAAKGAIIGAGAGTGAVMVTKGKEVEMPAGSRWVVRTRNSLRL